MKYYLRYSASVIPVGSVLVFCPVKGVRPGLEANARSLLRQNHTDYRVIFVVESKEDSACPILSGIDGAELFVSGQAVECGQKVHSLASAVKALAPSVDILVFCDSDARFKEDWLENLTAPLSNSSVGAATGYRWHLTSDRKFTELLQSAWNASVVGFLGDHSKNFTWGGSTAIRKETFDEAAVLEAWKGALSDDYSLTRAIRQFGYNVVYVPNCLVPCADPCGWKALFEFTTRQVKITKVYAWETWKMGFASHTIFNLAFWSLAFSMLFDSNYFFPWALLYLLAILRAAVLLRGVHRIDERFGKPVWFFLFAPPLVSLIYQCNFLLSLTSKRITWANVSYTMDSSSVTRIDSA